MVAFDCLPFVGVPGYGGERLDTVVEIGLDLAVDNNADNEGGEELDDEDDETIHFT